MSDTRRSAALRWLPGTIILATLLVFALRAVDWQRFAELLRNAEPAWLLVGVLLQLGTYLCAAAALHRGIAASDVHRSILTLIPMGLAKLFVDQVVPTGGLGGTVLVVRALERRQVPRGVATAAIVVNLLAFYGAYVLAVLGALYVLWDRHGLHPAAVVLFTLFAVYATTIPVLILWIVYGARRGIPAWVRRIRGFDAALKGIQEAPSSTLRHPLLFLESLVLQVGIIVLDALTLLVLIRALGHDVTFPIVFTSFVLASAAGTISLLPGGLGSFEAASVASLRFLGLPLELALASTLLLRGYTLWLPMIPGVWFANHEMMGAREEPP
jgi:glycosyltransferase 2 family protein